jgi:hypothetical protein
MKSSSLKLIKSGVDPSHYRDALIHDWFLEDMYSKQLEIFILKETTPQEFFDNIKDGEVRIKGRNYSVIWINSPSASRRARRLLISIRFCGLLHRGYALVKILEKGQFDTLEYT